VFDRIELEEESVLLEADRSSSRLYRTRRDGSLIAVKLISLSDSISKSQIGAVDASPNFESAGSAATTRGRRGGPAHAAG
jgi:hypothetical protein